MLNFISTLPASAGKYENLASDSWSDLVKNPKQWRDHRENKLKGLVDHLSTKFCCY